MMSANKNKNTHSFFDIAKAVAKFTPRLPQFLTSNIKLAAATRNTIASPGFIFEQQVNKQPSAAFLHFENERYTYGEFNRWVNRLAHTLKAQGIAKGDCVGVMLENRPALIAMVLAVNKIGAIAGMLNHKQRESVLAHSLNLIKPKLLVVGEECVAAMATAEPFVTECHLASIPHFYIPDVQQCDAELLGRYRNLLLASADATEENPLETGGMTLNDECYYVFTSGTTGLPKAAPMTNLRWYKAGIAFGQMAMGLKPKDVLYCCLPLYHNTALAIGLSCVLSTGASMALARKFSVSHFWQDIRNFKATSFVYIGEICRYLLNTAPQASDNEHQVRVMVGNGLRAEIWDEFQQRFHIPRICELYGASEGNIGFVNAFNLKRTVGFSPMKFRVVSFDVDNEVPIVANNGYMQKVGKGEVGLLLSEVSKKAPFDGYTKKQANESKLLRNVFRPGDCWFNTGDLVRMQGYRHVAFVDRVGDTFRWKAENVATTEVEAEIHTFKDIVEAVVYGVKVPNTDGRAGMASLILEKGHSFNHIEFYEHIKRKLPDYAVPLFVRLRDYHETTTTFKVKKGELKKEGFRPSRVEDSIFVLIDRSLGYQRLNDDILADIESGNIRF